MPSRWLQVALEESDGDGNTDQMETKRTNKRGFGDTKSLFFNSLVNLAKGTAKWRGINCFLPLVNKVNYWTRYQLGSELVG